MKVFDDGSVVVVVVVEDIVVWGSRKWGGI